MKKALSLLLAFAALTLHAQEPMQYRIVPVGSSQWMNPKLSDEVREQIDRIAADGYNVISIGTFTFLPMHIGRLRRFALPRSRGIYTCEGRPEPRDPAGQYLLRQVARHPLCRDTLLFALCALQILVRPPAGAQSRRGLRPTAAQSPPERYVSEGAGRQIAQLRSPATMDQRSFPRFLPLVDLPGAGPAAQAGRFPERLCRSGMDLRRRKGASQHVEIVERVCGLRQDGQLFRRLLQPPGAHAARKTGRRLFLRHARLVCEARGDAAARHSARKAGPLGQIRRLRPAAGQLPALGQTDARRRLRAWCWTCTSTTRSIRTRSTGTTTTS